MTEYAQILIYAIPGFFVLILIEWFFGYRKKTKIYRLFDTISSLSSGVTNSIKDVLGLSIVIIGYGWFFDTLAVQSISTSWLVYGIAFVAIDFAGYWSHRFEHQINILWNRHIIHHSSEEFNLACALRQNISAIFALFSFLLIPAALMGVPPKVIAIVAPLHLFAQFWYHTRLIEKMGWLENILVTPSHHRVHHAINDVYLDKNFSQVFIIWDKLFGTFQAELPEEEAVYGVKRAAKTWNPIIINYQHLSVMLKDAWHTKSIVDKFKLWMMPTGWRPKDVEERYPIAYIKDPHTATKYDTPSSDALRYWSLFQFVITLMLTLYMFSIIDQYSLPFLITFGLFLFVTIYGYTSLMDHQRHTIIAEVLKLVLVALVFHFLGHWFGLSISLLFGYCTFSLMASIYFVYTELRSKTQII